MNPHSEADRIFYANAGDGGYVSSIEAEAERRLGSKEDIQHHAFISGFEAGFAFCGESHEGE